MSYEDRINAALDAVKQHNEAFGGVVAIDPAQFILCIKSSGGTTEERLASFTYEDILSCLPEGPGGVKPKILAKDIAENIFRKKDRSTNNKKVDKMTARELIESFDPEDYSNSIGIRLNQMAKDEKFIVYSDGRIIDVDTTLKLLNEIKAGYPGRDDITIEGIIKKTYRVGELPENYADENPLYYDRPLRPDGTCDQTGRSWEGIDPTVRQFIRVAMDEGELKISHEVAHAILDTVMERDALQQFRLRYRKTSLKFDELAKTGKLPVLKILLNNKIIKKPFPDGKKVTWNN